MIKTIAYKDHYVLMTRRFVHEGKMIWYANALVTLGCFIAFWMINGKELVYSFYIPLDFALNASKFSFFWYQYWVDKIEKQDHERLQEIMNKKSSQKEALMEKTDEQETPDGNTEQTSSA